MEQGIAELAGLGFVDNLLLDTRAGDLGDDLIPNKRRTAEAQQRQQQPHRDPERVTRKQGLRNGRQAAEPSEQHEPDQIDRHARGDMDGT